MTDERTSMNTFRCRVYLIGALIVVVVAGMAGEWWVRRPIRSAERFISWLSQRQVRQASAMLRDSSQIQSDASGSVVIQARDGITAKLTQGELPLVAYGDRADRDWAARAGIGDYLASRYRFQVSTSGPAHKGGQKKPTILCDLIDNAKRWVSGAKHSCRKVPSDHYKTTSVYRARRVRFC